MHNRPALQTVDELEVALSTPTERLVESLGRLTGDILILGVGGKMGPTLARMAQRATEAAGVPRRVIGVSRFSDTQLRDRLESWGVQTIAGDLLDEQFIQSLPSAPYIIYMAGFKFGASSTPSMTWAMNCHVPALVCQRFRDSQVVAFSTGNVYGMVPVNGDASTEDDPLRPVGEYAMACLGRERIFDYFSRMLDIPLVLLRLNYATELRYGVLVDLALQIWDQQPIDVTMGYVNVIWQADANAMALAALDHVATPPLIVNISGPDKLSVRQLSEQLGQLMDKPVQVSGDEASDAFLSNGRLGYQLLGRPTTGVQQMCQWTVDWIRRGGETLGKPTKFQSRDGRF